MIKKGIKIEARYEEGLQDGLMKIQKIIKGQRVNYRGEFEKGHEKGYSVNYSRRV